MLQLLPRDLISHLATFISRSDVTSASLVCKNTRRVGRSCKAMKRRLVAARSQSPEQMLDVILRQGWVESNCGRYRDALVRLIKARGLKCTQVIVDYTGGKKWVKSRVAFASYQRLLEPAKFCAKWIRSGRVDKDELKAACAMEKSSYFATILWDEICLVFNKTRAEICKVLDSEPWNTQLKHNDFHPFERIALRKPIKRISLV